MFVSGGHFDLILPSARTMHPHGACVYTGCPNQGKRPLAFKFAALPWTFVRRRGCVRAECTMRMGQDHACSQRPQDQLHVRAGSVAQGPQIRQQNELKNK